MKLFLCLFLLLSTAFYGQAQCTYSSLNLEVKGPLTVCAGSTHYYVSQTTVPVFETSCRSTIQYSWSINGGGTIVTGFANSGLTQIQWGVAPGEYTVTLSVSWSGGTTQVILTKVNVISQTTSIPGSIAGNQSTCINTSTAFTVSPGAPSGQSISLNAYNLNHIDVNETSGLTVNWKTRGSYLVTASYNTGSCVGSSVYTGMVIQGSPETPKFARPNSEKLCKSTSEISYLVNEIPGENYSWSLNGTPLPSTQPSNEVKLSWPNEGSFTLSVKSSNTCSGESSPLNLIVTVGPTKPAAPPAPTLSAQAICNGGSITATTPLISGQTFQWLFYSPAGHSSGYNGSNTITQTFNGPAGNFGVSVRADNGFCLSDESSKVPFVVRDAISSSNPMIEATRVCGNQTVTLSTKGNLGTSYTWSLDGGQVTGPQNMESISANWITGGKKAVTVVVGHPCGSSYDQVMNIPVFVQSANPTLPEIIGPSTLCVGTYQFYLSSYEISSVTWSVNGVAQSSTLGHIYIPFNAFGQYVVSATAHNSCGTLSTKNTTVNVVSGTKPFPSITGASEACVNSTVTYSTTSSATGYQWYRNFQLLPSTTNSQNVTWDGLESNERLSLKISNGICESDFSHLFIDVMANPVAGTISTELLPEFCNSGTFAITPSGNAGREIKLDIRSKTDEQNWSPWTESPQTITSSPFSVTVSASTLPVNSAALTYEYRLKVKSGTCAPSYTNAVSAKVYGSSLAGSILITPPAICDNETATVAINGSRGSTITWERKRGNNPFGVYSVAANQTSFSYTPLSGTTVDESHYFRVRAKNGTCPESLPSLQQTLTVKRIPVLTPVAQTAICSETSPMIPLSINNQAGTPSFSWTSMSSNATGASSGSGTVIDQILSTTNGGDVFYDIIPTLNGCSGTASRATVQVKPRANIAPSLLDTTICSGLQTNIPLTSNVAGTTFNWTVTSKSSNISGPSSGSGTVLNQTITNTSNSTVGDVKYSITPVPPATACAGSGDDIKITVYPKASLTSASKTVCSGEVFSLQPTSSFPSATFTWTAAPSKPVFVGLATNGSGTIQGPLNHTDVVNATVNYNVTPYVGTCAGTPGTIPITVKPYQAPTISGSTIICSGSPASLTANPSGGTYLWSTGQTTRTITRTTAGIVTVTVTHPTFCSGTTSTTLTTGTTPATPTIGIGYNGLCGQSSSPNAILYTSAADAYQWSTGATSPTITVYSVNTYSVTITKNGCKATGYKTVGCGGTSSMAMMNADATTADEAGKKKIIARDGELILETVADFSVYPNPSDNNLEIEFEIDDSDGPYDVSLINQFGQVVIRQGLEPRQRNITLEIKHLPEGMYLLQLEQPLRKESKKVMILHN